MPVTLLDHYHLDPNQVVQYGALILIIAVVVHALAPSLLVLIAILIGLVVVAIMHDYYTVTQGDYVDRMMDILRQPFFNHYGHFYLDPDLTQLVWDHRDLAEYNSPNYHNMMYACERILQIKQMLEARNNLEPTDGPIEQERVVDPGLYFTHIIEYRRQALNYAHAMIHSFPTAAPTQPLIQRYQNFQTQLRARLDQHSNDVYELCRQYYASRPVTTETKFFYPHHPAPMPSHQTHAEAQFEFHH